MKRIQVIATGGTIASMPSDDGLGGLAPALGGAELVARVPLIGELCDIDVVQLMNIDSTNMRPSGWLRIAAQIEQAYDTYDGFVVLHGTDTMAYTAAALSYLVQGSPKPIVLTGSQQPMAAPFTDAKLNLYQSLLWACDDEARDVHVVFDGKVIVGTRAHKQRTMSFNAFTSVNWPLAALIRGGRVVRELGGMTAPPAVYCNRPTFYHQLDERVVVLKLTPGLGPEVFEALAGTSSAVILETFGIGGIPDGFEKALFGWVDAGHTLVLTTQVPEEGLDLGVYEVGRAYAEHPGILLGDDMTVEALVAKTMWVCGTASGPRQLGRLFELPINHDRLA
ncbi:MAG: asparaginase [Atopobiaceae bacterium]|nr:asparaginase [Atopobiaceae bacterium]